MTRLTRPAMAFIGLWLAVLAGGTFCAVQPPPVHTAPPRLTRGYCWQPQAGLAVPCGLVEPTDWVIDL